MKRISEFIIEKLKVSNAHNLPSIDDFVNMFLEYINQSNDKEIRFRYLESCKDFKADDPETFVNVLPAYRFKGNEEFLHLRSNKRFAVPKGTIYTVCIELYKDKLDQNYYFTVFYLPESGMDKGTFSGRHWFDIYTDDLVEIIGEDKYLEIYDYMKNYK